MVRAVTPIPFVKARFFDRCGKPLAGGQIYTYEANTTTPKVTYKDPYGLTPNTNPIILDAAGEADIYLDGTYRIRITDRNEVLINDVAKIGSWFSENLQDALNNVSMAMTDALQPKIVEIDEVIVEAKNSADVQLANLQTAINMAYQAGAGANGWTASLIQDASGKTQQQINDATVKNGEFGSLLATTVKLVMNNAKASLKYGLNGDGLFDDNNNNFRGLAKPNEPWADENTGIGSTAFGRDNATFAYLSMANGHGCSNFGVASFAGGAGSGTGNPDVPSDGANYGYCSLAYGKDTSAIGRISTAFGQNCKATSIHSFSAGNESISGAGLDTHPNALGGGGVVSNGDCAFSYGYRAYAYGDYALAVGGFVQAYGGAMVIGRGINPGSPLINDLPGSIAFGAGVDVPTVLLGKGDGTNGGFGKLGINTKNPTERIDINIQNGDKVSVSVPANGTGSLDLQGKLSNGSNASIFRVEYTSPNAGSAYGITNFYQNGVKAFSLNESGEVTFEKRIIMKNRLEIGSFIMVNGEKILGGQQAAIADSTGTAADNARAINAILAAMRGHGLIAS